MTKELAGFLVKAAEHCGTEVSLRDDYSGRGMYGQTTYALVISNMDEMVLNVIQYIKEMSLDNYDTTVEFIQNIPDVSDMGRLRSDNMGRDSVVVY